MVIDATEAALPEVALQADDRQARVGSDALAQKSHGRVNDARPVGS